MQQVGNYRFGKGIEQGCQWRMRWYGHTGRNRVIAFECKTHCRGPFGGCIRFRNKTMAQHVRCRIEQSSYAKRVGFDCGILKQFIETISLRFNIFYIFYSYRRLYWYNWFYNFCWFCNFWYSYGGRRRCEGSACGGCTTAKN